MRIPFAYYRNSPPLPVATVPLNLTADDTGVFSVILNWTPVVGAEKYRLIIPTDIPMQEFYSNIAGNLSSISIDPSFLEHGVAETVRIQSYNGFQWSASSNPATFTPYYAPIAPTGFDLFLNAAQSNNFTATWNVTQYATKYRLINEGVPAESDNAGINFNDYQNLGGNTVVLLINRVSGSLYKMSVQAYNGRAWSVSSNIDTSLFTFAPIQLNTFSSTNNSITFNIGGGNVGPHYIEWGTVAGVYTNNFTKSGSGSYTATGLLADTLYYFRVTHVKGNVVSAVENFATTP